MRVLLFVFLLLLVFAAMHYGAGTVVAEETSADATGMRFLVLEVRSELQGRLLGRTRGLKTGYLVLVDRPSMSVGEDEVVEQSTLPLKLDFAARTTSNSKDAGLWIRLLGPVGSSGSRQAETRQVNALKRIGKELGFAKTRVSITHSGRYDWQAELRRATLDVRDRPKKEFQQKLGSGLLLYEVGSSTSYFLSSASDVVIFIEDRIRSVDPAISLDQKIDIVRGVTNLKTEHRKKILFVVESEGLSRQQSDEMVNEFRAFGTVLGFRESSVTNTPY